MKRKKEPIQINIVDNQLLFSLALKTLLEAKTELHLSVEIPSGHPQTLEKNEPDILFLSSNLVNSSGTRIVKPAAEKPRMTKIIVLGDSASREEMAEFFEQGAYGFVDKESPSHVLFDAIKAVMAGKYWVGKKAASRLGERFGKHPLPPSADQKSNYGLTPREVDVIKTVISGRTNKEIAGQLAISEQTVKHHITNIFDKLGVYNRLELTLFVFHHGLVED